MAQNPKGASTKYKDNYARMGYFAKSEGAFTNAKLSRLFNVSKSMINKWKHDYPELLDTIKKI